MNAMLFHGGLWHSRNNEISPFFRAEVTGGARTTALVFKHISGEQNAGGMIHIYGGGTIIVDDVADWDAKDLDGGSETGEVGVYNNHLFGFWRGGQDVKGDEDPDGTAIPDGIPDLPPLSITVTDSGTAGGKSFASGKGHVYTEGGSGHYLRNIRNGGVQGIIVMGSSGRIVQHSGGFAQAQRTATSSVVMGLADHTLVSNGTNLVHCLPDPGALLSLGTLPEGREYVVRNRNDTYWCSVVPTQTVRLTGSPTGGTFTLTFGGNTTSALAYNATAADVEAALVALASVGANKVSVAGGPGPSTPWTVSFTLTGTLTASGAGLTGGTAPAVTVSAPTVAGVSTFMLGPREWLRVEADGTNWVQTGGVELAAEFEVGGLSTPVSNSGALTYVPASAAFGGGYVRTAGAQNNIIIHRLKTPLQAGTWTLVLLHYTGTNAGIYTMETSTTGGLGLDDPHDGDRRLCRGDRGAGCADGPDVAAGHPLHSDHDGREERLVVGLLRQGLRALGDQDGRVMAGEILDPETGDLTGEPLPTGGVLASEWSPDGDLLSRVVSDSTGEPVAEWGDVDEFSE